MPDLFCCSSLLTEIRSSMLTSWQLSLQSLTIVRVFLQPNKPKQTILIIVYQLQTRLREEALSGEISLFLRFPTNLLRSAALSISVDERRLHFQFVHRKTTPLKDMFCFFLFFSFNLILSLVFSYSLFFLFHSFMFLSFFPSLLPLLLFLFLSQRRLCFCCFFCRFFFLISFFSSYFLSFFCVFFLSDFISVCFPPFFLSSSFFI